MTSKTTHNFCKSVLPLTCGASQLLQTKCDDLVAAPVAEPPAKQARASEGDEAVDSQETEAMSRLNLLETEVGPS